VHPDFAAYHRARRRAVLPGRIALVLVAALLVGAAGWGIVSRPVPVSAAAASASGDSIGVLAGAPAGGAPAGTVPEPPAADLPAPPVGEAAPGPAAASGEPRAPLSVAIGVTARGHQAELDLCQWVRMDIGAVAPIVGAHNYCRGDVVLDLLPGDLVALTGTELDGDYQVTGSRDAQAGDDPAAATAGLAADLLLQTCYWGDAGLRLVTLRRVDLSLPPTPAP
jgi:hypothetical protein